MSTTILIKSFRTAAEISPYFIVAARSDGMVATASGKADKLLGTAGSCKAKAGEMIDVAQCGWGEVVCGGNVSFGDFLTSDPKGQAIKAEAADRTIGIAMSDGSAGDVISFKIN
ncbi:MULTISPECIES: capsid cement protein [unclassified Bartonella]|uniref:capsid cement protein n=1 Tax=unclassified Bartonella TaxID=2645622 RepID=UPI0020C43171|nr:MULTISPECIES: capsid cement protein [unclassified Bartonella]